MKKIRILSAFILITLITCSGCGIFHWKGKIPDYKEQAYSCQDSRDIHTIIVDNDDMPVEVHPSENGNIYLSFYLADDKSNQYDIIEKDGILSVKNRCEPNYGIFVFGDEYTSDSYREVKLALFIPEDYSGSLSVRTLDRNIIIYEIAVGELTIKTNDGNVIFKNPTIGRQLLCQTKDGDIKGTLAGSRSEFTYIAGTAGGREDMPSSQDEKKAVKLLTKDGNINISFQDEKGQTP